VIAWVDGPDLATVAGRLYRALGEFRLEGAETNKAVLQTMLRQPDFLAGRFDTGFVEDHAAVLAEMGIPFTDLRRDGSVKGWKARDILSLELITRGLSRRWTTGFATMPDVGSTFGACAGRTGSPALAAE
jgi:hypothetical protein